MSVSEVLRKLLTAPGPSGYEQAAAAVFRDAAASFAEVSHDSVGSSVARVKGTADGPLLAVIGHIDEIGLIVHHIDDDGFLWFSGVGGWDPVILVGQRVEDVPGVVTALRSNGFSLQDPDGDGRPETSDAVFVFTRDEPTVAVGDRVRVSGQVREFRAAGEDTNLALTEIAMTVVTIVAREQPLPAPMRAAVSRDVRKPVRRPASTTGVRSAGTPSSSNAKLPSPPPVVGSAVTFISSDP